MPFINLTSVKVNPVELIELMIVLIGIVVKCFLDWTEETYQTAKYVEITSAVYSNYRQNVGNCMVILYDINIFFSIVHS